MQHKILIVEDGIYISDRIKDVPSLKLYTILYAHSAEEAFTILSEDKVDVVVSDDDLTIMSGMEFLAFARQKCPDAIQMILTDNKNFKSAIRAINEGKIYRLFSKPCNVVDMALTIHCVLHKKKHLKRIMQAWQGSSGDDSSNLETSQNLPLNLHSS
jgi:DNA-binding NtrC family response regulator